MDFLPILMGSDWEDLEDVGLWRYEVPGDPKTLVCKVHDPLMELPGDW